MRLKDALRTVRFKGKSMLYHQMYTVWGEGLNPEHVREEYPRPQLRRTDYEILNGYWKCSITKDSKRPYEFLEKILVPFSPESILSGVNRQLKPEEYLWYERSLHIPAIDRNKKCILHFGGVDQYALVYINGVMVKEHMGGFLPFSADITDYLIEGINLLTVVVTDSSDTSYHSRGKQKLKRGGMFYTAQSGIWQTVWMEWVPKKYIVSLNITPLIDAHAVQVEIILNSDEEDTTQEEYYKVECYDEKQLMATMVSRYPMMIIPLIQYTMWSPEEPKLYQMVITVGADRVESYFAMRKFEKKRDEKGIFRLYLNNKPYFQNGLLDQGYWPDGLYTAPSDEAMIFDIEQAKMLGFNMLRKHIKIEPLRWYYHCDRLGMIVWQDMVNGGGKYNMLVVGYLPTLFPKLTFLIQDSYYRLLGRKDPAGREEWTRECEETVELLYNCPCIAAWVPFNEGWGQFDSALAAELIQELDTTRFIDAASGWFDGKAGDFYSIHNYFHPLDITPDENRAVVLSEFGGYACYIPEHVYSWQIYGYRIYLTKEDFNEAFQKLYREEISRLKEKGLAAAVYTQLSDVEDEVNGLFTYDRRVCKVEPLNEGGSKGRLC